MSQKLTLTKYLGQAHHSLKSKISHRHLTKKAVGAGALNLYRRDHVEQLMVQKEQEERKTKQSTRKRKLICLLQNHEDFLQKWIVLNPKRHYE